MSRGQIIVSAVHELDTSAKEWWDTHKDSLDGFEKEYDHTDSVEWHFCEGTFKSMSALKQFNVKMSYHSNRGSDVVEIILNCSNPQDVQITKLDEIITEINERFDCKFTLETYYWYTGVDKPGGTSR